MAKGKEVSQGRTQPEDKGKGKEAKTLPEIKGLEDDRGKEATPKMKESKLVKP